MEEGDYGPAEFGLSQKKRPLLIYKKGGVGTLTFAKRKTSVRGTTDYYTCTQCKARQSTGGNKGAKLPSIRIRLGRIIDDPVATRNPHFCQPLPEAEVDSRQLFREAALEVMWRGKKPRDAYNDALVQSLCPLLKVGDRFGDDPERRREVERKLPPFSSIKSVLYRGVSLRNILMGSGVPPTPEVKESARRLVDEGEGGREPGQLMENCMERHKVPPVGGLHSGSMGLSPGPDSSSSGLMYAGSSDYGGPSSSANSAMSTTSAVDADGFISATAGEGPRTTESLLFPKQETPVDSGDFTACQNGGHRFPKHQSVPGMCSLASGAQHPFNDGPSFLPSSLHFERSSDGAVSSNASASEVLNDSETLECAGFDAIAGDILRDPLRTSASVTIPLAGHSKLGSQNAPRNFNSMASPLLQHPKPPSRSMLGNQINSMKHPHSYSLQQQHRQNTAKHAPQSSQVAGVRNSTLISPRISQQNNRTNDSQIFRNLNDRPSAVSASGRQQPTTTAVGRPMPDSVGVANGRNAASRIAHGSADAKENAGGPKRQGCNSCGFSMSTLEQMFANWFGLLLSRFEDHDKNLAKLLDLVKNPAAGGDQMGNWGEAGLDEGGQVAIPVDDSSAWMVGDYDPDSAFPDHSEFDELVHGDAKQFENIAQADKDPISCYGSVHSDQDFMRNVSDNPQVLPESSNFGERADAFLDQLNQEGDSDFAAGIESQGKPNFGERIKMKVKQEILLVPESNSNNAVTGSNIVGRESDASVSEGFRDKNAACLDETTNFTPSSEVQETNSTSERSDDYGVDPGSGAEPPDSADQFSHNLDDAYPDFDASIAGSSEAAQVLPCVDSGQTVALETTSKHILGDALDESNTEHPSVECQLMVSSVLPISAGGEAEGSTELSVSSPPSKRRKHSGSSSEACSPPDMDLDRFLTEKVKCQVCTATLPSRAYAAQHLRAHFAGQDPLCGRCGNVFGSPDELTKHLMEVHGL